MLSQDTTNNELLEISLLKSELDRVWWFCLVEPEKRWWALCASSNWSVHR